MKIYCPQTEKKSYYKYFKFPAGEPHLILNSEVLNVIVGVNIEFNFSQSEDIIELLMLAHTLKLNNIPIGNLIIPYMPFAQADRVNEPGECFSLRLFCELINNVVKPDRVTIYDPHSDVAPALLNNCHVIQQWEILQPIITQVEDYSSSILVCPDAGARKKIIKLAHNICIYGKIAFCDKIRNTSNGEITGVQVDVQDFYGRNAIIVDDVCVGGRTFIEIAKILRNRNAGRIILVTTHGIYNKGLEVFSDIDEIWNRKGRLK